MCRDYDFPFSHLCLPFPHYFSLCSFSNRPCCTQTSCTTSVWMEYHEIIVRHCQVRALTNVCVCLPICVVSLLFRFSRFLPNAHAPHVPYLLQSLPSFRCMIHGTAVHHVDTSCNGLGVISGGYHHFKLGCVVAISILLRAEKRNIVTI